MRFFILLWTLSSGYTTASSLFCESILDTSQLSKTGMIELNSPTALNGVITVKSERIPYGGVLEFLIEHEENQDDSERDGSRDRENYDALMRIEFTRDRVLLSSRTGQDLFGEIAFQLVTNETESYESLTLQLLGSDELSGNTLIKIFGNTLKQKVNNYPLSEKFLNVGNWNVDVKIRKIFKTFETSVFDFCSTSYPGIVCEPDLFQGSNSNESLILNNDKCIETLVAKPGEDRVLMCIGYGAPDMEAEWKSREEKFKLIETDPDFQTSYKGSYALQTTRKLVINNASLPGEVTCELWNKNFDFPLRSHEKTFLITINPKESQNPSPCPEEPCLPPPDNYKPTNIAKYIICFILATGVISALILITAAVCRKRRGIPQIRSFQSEKCRKDSVPKITLPPAPKTCERQVTTSTIVSSSIGKDPEVEHIYQTIDDIQDPNDYCYAWTVPAEVLRKSKVDVKMVLSPTAVSMRKSQGFVRQSSVGRQSTFSQSSSGASAYQQTYSNTGLYSKENLPIPSSSICIHDIELVPEYIPGAILPPIKSRAQRQSTKSEYISLSAAEARLDISSLEEAGESPASRSMMQPILKNTLEMFNCAPKQLISSTEQTLPIENTVEIE